MLVHNLQRGPNLKQKENDYRVLVHPRLTDYFPEVGIQQFNHQELQLPSNSKFYPSPGKLQQHRQRFAFPDK